MTNIAMGNGPNRNRLVYLLKHRDFPWLCAHHFQMDSDISWSLRIPMDDESAPGKCCSKKRGLYPAWQTNKKLLNMAIDSEFTH